MVYYPLVNKQLDPDFYNQFLMDTNLPTPKNGRVELLIYWMVLGLTHFNQYIYIIYWDISGIYGISSDIYLHIFSDSTWNHDDI